MQMMRVRFVLAREAIGTNERTGTPLRQDHKASRKHRIPSDSKNEAGTTKQVERRSHRSTRCVLQLSPEPFMKIMLFAGLILVVLGIASLLVPIPHTEKHGIKAGDVNIGVETTQSERVSPIISVVLIAGGIALTVGGARMRSSPK
jgi:hypothetical protein